MRSDGPASERESRGVLPLAGGESSSNGEAGDSALSILSASFAANLSRRPESPRDLPGRFAERAARTSAGVPSVDSDAVSAVDPATLAGAGAASRTFPFVPDENLAAGCREPAGSPAASATLLRPATVAPGECAPFCSSVTAGVVGLGPTCRPTPSGGAAPGPSPTGGGLPTAGCVLSSALTASSGGASSDALVPTAGCPCFGSVSS